MWSSFGLRVVSELYFRVGKLLVEGFICIAIANTSGQAHVVLNEKKLPYSTTLQVWPYAPKQTRRHTYAHTEIHPHMLTHTFTRIHTRSRTYSHTQLKKLFCFLKRTVKKTVKVKSGGKAPEVPTFTPEPHYADFNAI